MSTTPFKCDLKSVLIIDDDEVFRALLKTFFTKILPDARFDFYDPVQQGIPSSDFDWSKYDLLVMDYDLGGGENGLEWLRKYKTSDAFPVTIMLTAQGSEEIAVDAMRFGAQDYINKTKLSLDRLKQAVNNATEKRQKQDHLSNTIKLQSNLFNKDHFYKLIKEVIGQQGGNKFAFLLQIQINNYKEIHEQHGLLQTDNYISRITTVVARLIQNEKLELNIVRMGDANICCLIHNCQDKQTGEKIAGMICDRIKQSSRESDHAVIEANISIGIVAISQGQNVEAVLEMADKACLSAAKQGIAFQVSKDTAGKLSAAEAGSKESGVGHTDKKARIDIAEIIKRNSIQPYFQPYIAMSETAASFKASYFRMCMNIVENDGKMFDVLEIKNMDIKNGNPGTMDLWAVRYALAQILSMRKENSGEKCGLFIRLFEESLRSNKLYEWMDSLIKKTKIPNIASTIVLEIWPPDYLAHEENALNIINKMRDTWGVGFALFDVENIQVLQTCINQAGFEFIKFNINSSDIKKIAEISQSARELGALTVIEQISNAQQLNTAIELGFDYGQGDFIQPPMDHLVLADVIEM